MSGVEQPSLEAHYELSSNRVVGKHVTQLAVDRFGDYTVRTNSDPGKVADLLERIAWDIRRDCGKTNYEKGKKNG